MELSDLSLSECVKEPSFVKITFVSTAPSVCDGSVLVDVDESMSIDAI